MLRPLILLWAMLPTAAGATDVDALLTALDQGDLFAATSFVTDLYEEAGASWDPTVEWRIDGFERMFNSYSPSYNMVDIGAIPKAAEVEAYWENWSTLLTEGAWDWRSFFATPEEAQALAAYNQFVLAAHEAGHALKFRYDLGHFVRHDSSISCREFHADILAAGLMRTLSAADTRLADLQARYLELLASLNEKIAPPLRFQPIALDALITDCSAMTVHQPTPERMSAYASAFFVRQAAMLGGDLPSLPELVASYLVKYKEAEVQLQYLDPAPTVETVGLLQGLTFGNHMPDLDYRVHDHNMPALTPKGQVYLVRLQTDERLGEGQGPLRGSLSFGRPGGELSAITEDEVISRDPIEDFKPIGAVALGDDQFAVLVRVDGNFVLFEYRRMANVWITNASRPLPNRHEEAVLTLSPSGNLVVLAGPKTDETYMNAGWYAYRLDAEALTVTETALPFLVGLPRGIDDAGNIYAGYLSGISRTAPNGDAVMLAGSGLPGRRDGEGGDSEFVGLSFLDDYSPLLQVTEKGDVVVLDGVGSDATTLRRISLARD